MIKRTQFEWHYDLYRYAPPTKSKFLWWETETQNSVRVTHQEVVDEALSFADSLGDKLVSINEYVYIAMDYNRLVISIYHKE